MKNQVICAAIRFPDGSVVRGHRHDGCIKYAYGIDRLKAFIRKNGTPSREIEQGFMTAENVFVDRYEGMRIQRAAGIESIRGNGGDMLFSEDLY